MLAGYDAVLHLVSCAKGAEFAYNFGNEARYEPLETAREKDDLTLRAWKDHPNLKVIDNAVDFEDKLRRGIRAIYDCLGLTAPQEVWHKYLIAMPDVLALEKTYAASAIDMMQTYLVGTQPNVVRRIRQQKNGQEYLYFYTEKRYTGRGRVGDGKADHAEGICPVSHGGRHGAACGPQDEIPPSASMGAGLKSTCIRSAKAARSCAPSFRRRASAPQTPQGIEIIREVTGDPMYKNSRLAREQKL